MSVHVATPIVKLVHDRVSIWLVGLYLFLILICLAAYPVWAAGWWGQPFIGGFVGPDLLVDPAGLSLPAFSGNGYPALPGGYQIQSIDGLPIQNLAQWHTALKEAAIGQVVTLEVMNPVDGQSQPIEVQLQAFPVLARFLYFIIPYLIGLVFWLAGAYILYARRNEPVGPAFSLFSATAALVIAGLFDRYTSQHLIYVWSVALVLASGALLNLALLFPEEPAWIHRRPILRWVGFFPAAALIALVTPALYNLNRPFAYLPAWQLEYTFAVLAVALFNGTVIYRHFRSSTSVVRQQTRLLFWGGLIAFAPILIWLLASQINPRLAYTPILLFSWVFFPVASGYAIMRYRVLNLDYLLSRSLFYILFSFLVVGGYGLILSGITLLVGNSIQPTGPLQVILLVLLLVVIFNPVRNRMQASIDTLFFKGASVYRERLQSFGRELTETIELPGIVGLLRKYIQDSLAPDDAHIFLYDLLSDEYQAASGEGGRPTSDLRFSSQSSLVKILESRREALFLGQMTTLPVNLLSEGARLKLLGCQLFIPLPGRQRLAGWLALGSLRSGEPYSERSLEFLEALCDQAALAVERAQVIIDLERRIQATNILMRVSQGTNFTIAFDDILELLSAQTNLAIPNRDFHITLFDRSSNLLRHILYIENDERLSEKENRPLFENEGLEMEVVRSQRALVTKDYQRECFSRNVSPTVEGVFSWMGVPLNAGAETIGVISLASRDPAQAYTGEQRDVLQAIADQAAGAIVKARLLQEAEQRARQLATLYEIGRSLTSTLEIKPLLNQILKSATAILNCEAGSLFLVDEHSDELVFEVVIGPVATDLVGKRLPPGTGLVGEAVSRQQPIIANNARRRRGWHRSTDEQTGFQTQDMLVVPMLINERVVGVIEVINKLDGSPFSQDDQDLLTTFSSQATIAIENARLYTLTDQALAARVEELSVMQRIDRELNTSLDIDRALQITLEWAIRQTQADAGLVGMLEIGGVRVIDARGYTQELESYLPSETGDQTGSKGSQPYLPAQLHLVHEVIHAGGPRRAERSKAGSPGEEPIFLLAEALGQIVIPIRREAEVIGIILLESLSAEKFSPEIEAFLMRLSDHAAIALANAQLYAEVREANLAKSKFVSFVAHELKNPMSSIKGYTELIAKGMAGPVNDLQSTFLATVRSNVDRMNTIVSDLNDLTKIQVGSLHLEYKTVDLHEIVEEAIRSLHGQIEVKEQDLSIELPAELPAVWADSGRLVQIMTNLISNANKYTAKGGHILICAEDQTSLVSQPAELEVVHVWVSDNGIGIAREDQNKIFEQYFRTDISKETANGTGLGLNITRSLVEMQGGKIWFESVLGQGTTFHFTIPVAEPA